MPPFIDLLLCILNTKFFEVQSNYAKINVKEMHILHFCREVTI